MENPIHHGEKSQIKNKIGAKTKNAPEGAFF
jgi:hypothetical protein